MRKADRTPDDTPIILQGIDDSSVAAGHTRQNVSGDFGKKKGTIPTRAMRTRYLT
jgi:hypothetical protein